MGPTVTTSGPTDMSRASVPRYSLRQHPPKKERGGPEDPRVQPRKQGQIGLANGRPSAERAPLRGHQHRFHSRRRRSWVYEEISPIVPECGGRAERRAAPGNHCSGVHERLLPYRLRKPRLARSGSVHSRMYRPLPPAPRRPSRVPRQPPHGGRTRTLLTSGAGPRCVQHRGGLTAGKDPARTGDGGASRTERVQRPIAYLHPLRRS